MVQLVAFSMTAIPDPRLEPVSIVSLSGICSTPPDDILTSEAFFQLTMDTFAVIRVRDNKSHRVGVMVMQSDKGRCFGSSMSGLPTSL